MAAELDFYKEHVEHGRHIEVQRSAVAGLAATISGAIIGELLKHQPLTKDQLPFTITLLSVGLIAWLLSAKLYERFKLHNAIAKAARDKLDPSLGGLRAKAERGHKRKFPILYALPLHWVWNVLFGIISLIGLGTTWICWRGNAGFQSVVHMRLDAPNLAVGFVLGILGSFIASHLYRAFTDRNRSRELKNKYGHLAGTYVNYRVNDGVETPTGGTVLITQNEDGSFKVEGLHSSGDLDWQGTLSMSLEWENTGIARYKYPAKADYGQQQVTVLPETRSLHVIGMNISHGKANQFIHHWKRKEA